MKTVVTFLLLTLLGLQTHAQHDFEWNRTVKMQKGVVKLMADEGVALIVPQANPNMRYISRELPDDWKKEGLPIQFAGLAGKIPPYIRMLGTPLKLSDLSVKFRYKKQFGLKKRKYHFKLPHTVSLESEDGQTHGNVE